MFTIHPLLLFTSRVSAGYVVPPLLISYWLAICSEAISHGSPYLICQQRPLNEQADVNVLLEYFVNYKGTDWTASGHCNGHSSSSGSQYDTTRCWDSVNRKSHNICVSQASSGTNANCMSSTIKLVLHGKPQCDILGIGYWCEYDPISCYVIFMCCCSYRLNCHYIVCISYKSVKLKNGPPTLLVQKYKFMPNKWVIMVALQEVTQNIIIGSVVAE